MAEEALSECVLLTGASQWCFSLPHQSRQTWFFGLQSLSGKRTKPPFSKHGVLGQCRGNQQLAFLWATEHVDILP